MLPSALRSQAPAQEASAGEPTGVLRRVADRGCLATGFLTTAVLAVLVLAVAYSYVTEALWWRTHERFLRVCAPARELSLRVESLRPSSTDRWPTSDVIARLTDGSGRTYIATIQEGARRVGVDLRQSDVTASKRDVTDAALLVLAGDKGRLEILAGGAVAVTASLAPEPRHRPAWLRILPIDRTEAPRPSP